MKAKKIWLSLILTIAMVVTLLPAMAFATEGDVAKIGDTGYPSLRAAIEAADSGDTIEMLADDRVSFYDGTGGYEIGNDGESLTINGNNHTVYGVSSYVYNNGPDHDFYISGSGDVTIKDLVFSEFGNNMPTQIRIYPIWTGQGYTGKLTLDHVTITKYNRTAVNLNGGSFEIKDSVFLGNVDPYNPRDVYQSGIGVLNAEGVIKDTVMLNMGAYSTRWEDSNVAGCIQLNGAGSITINDGTYAGDYSLITLPDAGGTITVNDGIFKGLIDREGTSATIAVNGGIFSDAAVTDFAATVAAVASNAGDAYYAVGKSIQEEAEDERSDVVVLKGDYTFDPETTKADLANDGNGTVTLGDKTIESTTKQLKEAKVTAKKSLTDLLAGKSESDYDPEDWEDLTEAINVGKILISLADTIDEVNELADEAVNDVNAIKTIAQKEAEALEEAKEAAKAELDKTDLTAYSEPELTAVKKAIADAKAAIDEATTKDAVAAALDNGKTAVAAQKTDAVKKAEETAAKQKKYAPAKVKLKKAMRSAVKKKRVLATWKIIKKGVTGYQVQIINKKTGETVVAKSYKQSKKLAKKNFIRRAINNKKLKKGKYKVKVRAYKIAEGRRWYGAWSNAKTVKLK